MTHYVINARGVLPMMSDLHDGARGMAEPAELFRYYGATIHRQALFSPQGYRNPLLADVEAAFRKMIARAVVDSTLVGVNMGDQVETEQYVEVEGGSAYFNLFTLEEASNSFSQVHRFAPGLIFAIEEGDGLQFTPDLDDDTSGMSGVFTPSAEDLERLPENARPFAGRYGVCGESASAIVRIVDGELEPVGVTLVQDDGLLTSSALAAEARQAYRHFLTFTRRGGATQLRPEDRPEAIAERRRAAAERFAAHFRREPDAEQHVGTLPFVPHGLASSRRWGIEVESGGARGVETPEDWDMHSDGSLRSAYDGWEEVEDFEPYDEEVTVFDRPGDCRNWARHVYEHDRYNERDRVYEHFRNPEYLDPDDCEHCGERTETVRREPRTIYHHAQAGDCKEFVSPILVSMHSRGLEYLTEELSQRPQNDSAGVHVHVEASDLTDEQVATMLVGYDMLEPILESSYRRNVRRFCERREAGVVLDVARHLRRGDSPDVTRGGRYFTLNTESLGTHGTLEFRAMGPVYEYDYLVRWAMLCRELVNVVAAGATLKDFSSISSWGGLLELLARFGKEYVRAAVYEMTGETGSVAALEKQGVAVTTEALDEDLATALQQAMAGAASAAGVSMSRWSETLRSALADSPRVSELVGVNQNGWDMV